MDAEKLKRNLGENIAICRRKLNLTQAQLAEKLNFSDKAVSKWERAESMPDVITLAQLAELFGTSVDALLRDEEHISFHDSAVSAQQTPAKRRADKSVIQKLCSLIVWFVALLIFVVCSSAGVPKTWISLIYAIPVNALVLLCLRSAWRNFRQNRLLISLLMWSFLLSVHLTLLLFAQLNLWMLYLLAIPGQTAIVLWFRLFKKPAAEEEHG